MGQPLPISGLLGSVFWVRMAGSGWRLEGEGWPESHQPPWTPQAKHLLASPRLLQQPHPGTCSSLPSWAWLSSTLPACTASIPSPGNKRHGRGVRTPGLSRPVQRSPGPAHGVRLACGQPADLFLASSPPFLPPFPGHSGPRGHRRARRGLSERVPAARASWRGSVDRGGPPGYPQTLVAPLS